MVAGSLNVSPIALDQAVTINEDTPAPITLTGSDADGNALTYTVVTQPAHGGVVQASPGSAGVTYTPAANFNGTDTFTVRNNDGRVDSNEVATITVTVGPVNDAPSFTQGREPVGRREQPRAERAGLGHGHLARPCRRERADDHLRHHQQHRAGALQRRAGGEPVRHAHLHAGADVLRHRDDLDPRA